MALTLRRRLIPAAVAALWVLVACQATPGPPPPPPVLQGPPSIPDTQPAVNAPLFVGQAAFANPLDPEIDFDPALVTGRVDGANSGVVDGRAPLGTAPVTGSAAVMLQAPLLWGRGGLTAGCQTQIVPVGATNCLAAVDTSTMTVTARWVPPGQTLNLATAVLDSQDRILVTTLEGHVFVLTRPDTSGGTFQVVRDVDLSGYLGAGQDLAVALSDSDGNLWFSTGTQPPSGQPAPDTTVGYVTPGGQVATLTLAGQAVNTAPAVDGEDVYLATAPTGGPAAEPPAVPADQGQVYDLTANGGQVQPVWHEPYDAGTAVKPGATVRGTGAPVVLLGTQFLVVTDNADAQEHLLVFWRGTVPATATTTTTSTSRPGGAGTGAGATGTSASTTPSTAGTGAGNAGGGTGASTSRPGGAGGTGALATPSTAGTGAGNAGGGTGDPRLVCQADLFAPGASAVTTAPIGYSSSTTDSVIVANGFGAPTATTGAADNGPANNLDGMPGGLVRIDVSPTGSGCQAVWSNSLRLQSAPVLSPSSGLLYGYTEDPQRAATGIYIWYFAGIDFRTGSVLWQQRAGAGSTKNDQGLPTEVGTDGVLYQLLPLGLVWMHDVNQQP